MLQLYRRQTTPKPSVWRCNTLGSKFKPRNTKLACFNHGVNTRAALPRSILKAVAVNAILSSSRIKIYLFILLLSSSSGAPNPGATLAGKAQEDFAACSLAAAQHQKKLGSPVPPPRSCSRMWPSELIKALQQLTRGQQRRLNQCEWGRFGPWIPRRTPVTKNLHGHWSETREEIGAEFQTLSSALIQAAKEQRNKRG